jgi:hypothetical protein
MDISTSRPGSRFRNLLDAVAADSVGLSRVIANDPSVLGPCVGDDVPAPFPNLSVLGPCVGDDEVSDARLKQDVCRIGTTVFGLPLYHFKYLGKPETYEGVMAQEVLKVMPGAVSVAADGFYRVNYRALGTVMRRVS